MLGTVSVLILLLVTPLARAEGGTINGTILDPDGEPIAGVVLTVTGDGDFTESESSGADGTWSVAVPGSGPYTVTLDADTLPEGVALTNPERSTLTVTLLSANRTVAFPTGEGNGGGESTLDRFLQLTVDGLVFGLVIALAGVGLSMIFGTTGLTNFAHGELVTLGALSTLVFNNFLGLPFVVSAALALVVSAAFGSLQDRGLWRQLRKRGVSLIAMLVVSIGFGILLRYMYLFFFGGATQQFASFSGQPGISLGPVEITPKVIVGSLVAIAAIAATLLWLGLSRTGKASRAISDNPALASASGINVERVINIVWIVGAVLAGLAGIIYSLSVGVNWFQGFQILLLVFAAVILGGLGTTVGALVGALVVGVLIQISTLVIPTELKNVGALFVMIVILLVRPQGLLGRAERVG
jgi:branched-chain amino acid transport system permease protein